MTNRTRLPRWICWAHIAMASYALVGCSVAQPEVVDPTPGHTVTMGSDADVSRWAETWEQAALDEARRLHPLATGLGAYSVQLPGIGQRVHVQGSFGFCRMYGGMGLKGRWRANEIGGCDPRFIRSR